MKTQVARAFAQHLIEACDQAEAEGRDALDMGDLDRFAAADDAARAELVEAIKQASENG